MKPVLMRHSEAINESFKIWTNGKPYRHNPWHYHPECEITYIYKGKGLLFIGDQMIGYSNNDVIMIGPNIPHEWRSDIKDFPDLYSESISIHFNPYFLGNQFYKLPESAYLIDLFAQSARGIKIEDESVKMNLKKLVKSLIGATAILRISKILEILHTLSLCPNPIYLSRNSFVDSIIHNQDHRIDQVCKYVLQNFTKTLSTQHVAAVIYMTTTSFCRFFKERTNKQFTRYLNEVRVGFACRLLLDGKLSVSQIAFESGFVNMSNFNKQFRKIKHMTPSQFVKDFS